MVNTPKSSSAMIQGLPWWQLNFQIIGAEKQPLLIIDNFVKNPETLIAAANSVNFSANAPYYPGIRAQAPRDYITLMQSGLADILNRIFDYRRGAKIQECFFSKVTTAPEDLNFVQRIPHVDGGDDGKVALLHYLSGKEHGGTAFYRQKRTGFETVPNSRFDSFKKAIEQDHAQIGPPDAKYYDGTDGRFEKIFEIEAKMNRAIIYFGKNLHSINISRPHEGTDRLTVNTFINPV